MNKDGDIKNYINNLQENEISQIYNLPDEKLKQYKIQLKQLIEYFNFKLRLKSELLNLNIKKEEFDDEIYLIDKKWFKKWKKHVGYKDIKAFYYKYRKTNELSENDHDWIEPIINNNISQQLLNPLDNQNIYDNKNKNELNIYSEFVMVNKKCFELFSYGIKNFNLNLIKNYKIIKYFDKLILIINDNINLLKFKEKEPKRNFEILIFFQKNHVGKNKLLDVLSHTDINKWIKNLDFNLYSEEKKEIKRLNICLINKTLVCKKLELFYQKEDNINKEILNVSYVIPDNLKKTLILEKKNLENMQKNQQTVLIKKNNNNNLLFSQKNINIPENLDKTINMNKIKNFNPKTTLNNKKNFEDFHLSETMMKLKFAKQKPDNPINNKEYIIYRVDSSEKINDKRPQENQKAQNQQINFNINVINNNINICSNCYNNFNNLNPCNINNSMNNMNNINSVEGNNISCQNNPNYFNDNSNNNNFNNNLNNNNFNANNNFNNNINNDNFNNNFNNISIQNFNNQIVPCNSNMNNDMNVFNGMNNNMNGFNGINNMNAFNSLSNNINFLNNNMNMKLNMNNMNAMLNMTDLNKLNNINIFNNFGLNNINNKLNPKTSQLLTKVVSLPHKIGLQNIGQTCYMNASLQCLTNIQSLSDELLQMHSQNKINTNQHPLTFAYTNLLYEFKTTHQSYIIPKSFKEVLEVLNPLFKGNQAADAKDLIFFIIERLHQELKPPEISLNNFNQIDFMQQEIEARNEELTRQKFLNELKLKNTSIISKTFHGIQRSVMKCEGCGNVKYSFQNFNILNFILKKIKEDKKNQFGEFLPNNYILNLLDCFDSENKLEKLEGENMIYCNSCKALKRGSIKQDIYRLPKILVIVLNRGKNNQDFREEFKLEEILDLENQCTIICNPQAYKKYFLCGIVTHLGESGSNGHFISYFRNSLDQNFLCYNDASVAEVGVQDAMKSKISFREDEDMIPYILFYHCFRS